ncbi:zeta toxin family protein [Lysobacter gummosus]|uniref:Zeta toxin family protein n=1 Tax=Lysobacter gummosus TaxID=262324 RepID=A0ABY3XII1_9GAMM|nr:zeta toxin family protein [Lysobacter gummosus]UNP31457.1 zeta toxin family protein [Lysobacter gummosus]
MDKEAHAKIFAERVLPDSGFSEATTQAKPRAIILAGQPGAGKTGLVKEAMREFKGDAVLVDPDELRKYVPNLKELQQAKPLGWSGDTLKDSSKWGNQLNRPGFRRHLAAINYGLSGGGYEREAIHR